MRSLTQCISFLHWISLILVFILPVCFFIFSVPPKTDVFPTTAVLNTLFLMVAVSVPSTALSFLFLWNFNRFQWPERLKKTVLLTLKMPYLLPPFFLVMGWVLSPAPSIYGLKGTALILIFWSTALGCIQLQSFFSQFPVELEDAAILAGASPWQTLFKITLPLAFSHIAGCALVLALDAAASFAVPALIALPSREHVLTTRIYMAIKSGQGFSEASMLSLIL